MRCATEDVCVSRVTSYFEGRGFTVFREVPFFQGWVDLVAIKRGKVVAVEVKVDHPARCFKQARRHTLFAHEVYAALPSSASSGVALRRARDSGIGLLSIGQDVTLVSRSLSPIGPIREYTDRIVSRCLGG